MAIKYVEDSTNEFKAIIRGIGCNECILFLGPLFGTTTENGSCIKINEALFQNLEREEYQLDRDFQNLFIRKDDSSDDFTFGSIIAGFYKEIRPDEVYKNIAKINFSAIITFTQDLFLVKAFQSQNFNFIFKYFSIKGTPITNPSSPGDDKIPIIYNYYGKYNDQNSLITNYSSFYKFLFSMLGENVSFPKELNNKLSNAKVFLFLGFDTKKWYVPLFVNKLFYIGRDNPGNKPMAIAALNDTDTENNIEYIEWMKRYPLNLKFTRDSKAFITNILAKAETEEIKNDDDIGPIIRTMDPKPILDKETTSRIHLYNDPDFIKKKQQFLMKIANLETPESLINLIDELIDFTMNKGYSIEQNDLINQESMLKSKIYDLEKGTITRTDFDVELARIRTAILNFVNPSLKLNSVNG